MAALVVPRPGFTGRGRFSGLAGIVLDPTSGVCVAVGSGPFPLSGACVRCGCGILELMGWFRPGRTREFGLLPTVRVWFREVPYIGA